MELCFQIGTLQEKLAEARRIIEDWEEKDRNTEFVLSSEDPFEAVVIDLVRINRAKRADYASRDNILKNFDRVAEMLDLPGYNAGEDILAMICRKVQRIVNLRGRPVTNESVVDSYDDLAVYAILAIVEQHRQSSKTPRFTDITMGYEVPGLID